MKFITPLIKTKHQITKMLMGLVIKKTTQQIENTKSEKFFLIFKETNWTID